MCPRTCALGLSSSLLSENKKKTTKVCEIGDRESYFGALFILWIHGKNSHIRTTCKLGGHDLDLKKSQRLNRAFISFFVERKNRLSQITSLFTSLFTSPPFSFSFSFFLFLFLFLSFFLFLDFQERFPRWESRRRQLFF